MKGPSNFGIANDFSFGKEECLNHNLPIFFISLKASSWLGEEELARKIVFANVGTVTDAEVGLSSLIQGFQKLKSIQELPVQVKDFADHVLKHYKRLPAKKRFGSHFTIALREYLSDNAKEGAAKTMLQENYRIHANLSTKTADDIIETATSTKGKGKEVEKGYESDSSCKSGNYHPRRTRNYSVGTLCEDNVSVSLSLVSLWIIHKDSHFSCCRMTTRS